MLSGRSAAACAPLDSSSVAAAAHTGAVSPSQLEEFAGEDYPGHDLKSFACHSIVEARVIAAREIGGADTSVCAACVPGAGELAGSPSPRDMHRARRSWV